MTDDLDLTDDTDAVDDTEATPLIKQLRQQLKQQAKELNTYKARERSQVFRDAGFDPDSGLGKLVISGYEGDLNAESIRAWAADQGIPTAAEPSRQEGLEAATRQRAESAQRIEQVRQGASEQAGGKRFAYDEWQRLMESNPREGEQAFLQGLVDPSPIAQKFGL